MYHGTAPVELTTCTGTCIWVRELPRTATRLGSAPAGRTRTLTEVPTLTTIFRPSPASPPLHSDKPPSSSRPFLTALFTFVLSPHQHHLHLHPPLHLHTTIPLSPVSCWLHPPSSLCLLALSRLTSNSAIMQSYNTTPLRHGDRTLLRFRLR